MTSKIEAVTVVGLTDKLDIVAVNPSIVWKYISLLIVIIVSLITLYILICDE